MAENVLHHRNPQEDEVAAVESLDHGPAGLVVLGDPQDEEGRPGDNGEDGGDGKDNQFRPQGLVQRRDVQVVEHHAEEKDFENHAVHAADFVVVQQFAPADVRARQDQKKQGDDGLDGDEKVLLHDFTPNVWDKEHNINCIVRGFSGNVYGPFPVTRKFPRQQKRRRANLPVSDR